MRDVLVIVFVVDVRFEAKPLLAEKCYWQWFLEVLLEQFLQRCNFFLLGCCT